LVPDSSRTAASATTATATAMLRLYQGKERMKRKEILRAVKASRSVLQSRVVL